VLRLRGGGASIYLAYGGRIERFSLRGGETLLDIKIRAHQSFGIPPEEQILTYDSEELEDGKLINSTHGV
jgi:hypothetical protein